MTVRDIHKTSGKYGFVILFFLLSWSSNAQTWAFEMWHEGRIVLVDGDTLKGLIKYDINQDVIQYTWRDQRVEAFSARKVLFYEIFDNSVRKYRQFFALPYSNVGSYRTPIFFELLEEGKLTLLSREKLEYRTQYTGFYGSSYQRLVLVYDYYFLEEDGSIKAFNGDRRDLLDKMGRLSDDVEDYMRENRLRLEDKYDFVKIVAFYNGYFKT